MHPTPEQRSVIETWGQGQAVLAGAGCGKTTTLVEKCLELLRRDPQARFAAVSFTERSASDLREKLTLKIGKLFASEHHPLARHWVSTIHGFCGSVIREFPREAALDGDERVLAEAEARLLWEEIIDRLWFEPLSESVEAALNRLLERESRGNLLELLLKTRTLEGFGLWEQWKELGMDAQALKTVSSHVLDRYERKKKRLGVLDFDDLERAADRALQSERVSRQIRARYDLFLVDEFQDTNPLQARILHQAVRPGWTNLCVVGDPKQSIYRFRDADVSLFEEFCSRLPVQQKLTCNFRSRPAILNYTNQVCSRLFAAAQLRYDVLEAGREPRADLESVLRLDIQTPEDLARWIGTQQAHGIGLQDMVILMHRVRNAQHWFRPLMQAGIPLAVGSGGLFWEDPRVRELVAFLRWWRLPHQNLSGAVFFRAPWMGIADATIDEWLREDITFEKPFFASDHPVARALSGLRGRGARLSEVLWAVARASDGIEQELGVVVLGLWHRIEEWALAGLDEASILRELSLAKDEKKRDRDVPPPRSGGALTVLTLHGAKGLEFPHVILLDFGIKRKSAKSPLLYWDRLEGAFFAGRDEDGNRLKKDEIEQTWKQRERHKNLAESMRLFYVALTRAQERLILVCPPIPEKDQQKWTPEKTFLEQDWRGWIECAGVAIPRQDASVLAATVGLDRVPVSPAIRPAASSAGVRRIRPRHSVTEWLRLEECPRRYEWTWIRPRSGQEPEAFEPTKREALSAGTRAAELGTRVHAALERRDAEVLRALEQEFGAGVLDAQRLITWMQESPLMEPAAENRRRVWTELAFEVPLDPQAQEVLVGSMDRLVWDEERYWIVDFKITPTLKMPAYSLQLELYAWALQQLEPGVPLAQMEARLIQITPQGVKEVTVALEGASRTQIEKRLAHARAIVEGASGVAQPGGACAYCEFRAFCPEGRTQ